VNWFCHFLLGLLWLNVKVLVGHECSHLAIVSPRHHLFMCGPEIVPIYSVRVPEHVWNLNKLHHNKTCISAPLFRVVPFRDPDLLSFSSLSRTTCRHRGLRQQHIVLSPSWVTSGPVWLVVSTPLPHWLEHFSSATSIINPVPWHHVKFLQVKI
jgi:hypothetical protein